VSRAVVICPGSRFAFDGEVVEVTGFEGTRVTLRDGRDRWRTLGLAGFLARAAPLEAPEGRPAPVGPLLAGLAGSEQSVVTERAGHVREVLTGYRSGTAEVARPGEPRPDYDPARPLGGRQEAKARELGVTGRTIRRWVRAYRDSGEAGLADARRVSGRRLALDPRWEEACRTVVAGQVGASTPTAGALLRLIGAQLDDQYGAGAVPRPSTAAAYRHLARLTKGTNAVKGSAKGRRSIAGRPRGVYGRLRAVRPGEYVILDTQDLDVFAMEPVTCRWVRAQLTVAQDLFTRCITGLRVTPVSTKAVDVAGVLYQTVAARPAPEDWPAEACWAYHGVPQHLVFTEAGRLPGIPVCPPETLVIDHGKAFLSAHVISVCTRLGISIQPAQPKKPTDKPTCERFFKTLREGLIQYLPAYKGPDIYSRGEGLEDSAFLFIHELEDVIREWVAVVYHRGRQDGLAVPEWPHLQLSPNEMYETGIARAGLLRIPASPELAYDFLATEWRTIQHYGVEVGGLRYNGAALDGYRNAESPYGGLHPGKWPVRVNPDDVRSIYFHDPDGGSWHRLEWEHAPGLGTPFSAEAARYARRLAARQDRWPDPQAALAGLLARWDQGMVTGRRERRIAVRLAAEHAALAVPDAAEAEGPGPQLRAAGEAEGDDDDAEEIFDAPGDGNFYADAFEILE
jgi:transposase InsO family protein